VPQDEHGPFSRSGRRTGLVVVSSKGGKSGQRGATLVSKYELAVLGILLLFVAIIGGHEVQLIRLGRIPPIVGFARGGVALLGALAIALYLLADHPISLGAPSTTVPPTTQAPEPPTTTHVTELPPTTRPPEPPTTRAPQPPSTTETVDLERILKENCSGNCGGTFKTYEGGGAVQFTTNQRNAANCPTFNLPSGYTADTWNGFKAEPGVTGPMTLEQVCQITIRRQ
jgi:hypothetical protein